MKKYYFNKFEHRKPYAPIEDNVVRSYIFQFCAIITLMLGVWYLHWRWTDSLNMQSLWFAIPLVVAESLSFIGTALMVFNMWSYKDYPKVSPPRFLSDIEDLKGKPDRPLKLDVHIATYNEDVELVRYSIRDAKKMTYPHKDVEIRIYVLDDGRRDGRDPSKENMKQVCEEEGIHYLCRENNEGYKAGNLKNGLEHTDGDIFVILDADTRPFEKFLENTIGYFCNKKVAWVQTPQWFYDTTEPMPFSYVLNKKLNSIGIRANRVVDKLFGWIKTGDDIFGNDPRVFYEVILRKRNYYNAAFCCGAGSIHRREAVIGKALKDFAEELRMEVHNKFEEANLDPDNANIIAKKVKRQSFLRHQLRPFKYHASEDIYTSMVMHDDPDKWISIQHPSVECKMLSPQDLDTSVKQRTRYASGSLDIAFKDNPFFKKNLSLGQKICYFNTIWSYFAPLWIIVFLLAPIIFFFTHTLPVQAYSFEFFKHFITFQVMNTITVTLGCWGIRTGRGEQYYISCFWLMMRSLISAMKGEKVKFIVTPKEKQGGNNMQHIWPHLTIIILTVTGIIYNLILIGMGVNPSTSGFVSNAFWGLFNVMNLMVILRAAYWQDWTENMETLPDAEESSAKKIFDEEKILAPTYSLASNSLK